MGRLFPLMHIAFPGMPWYIYHIPINAMLGWVPLILAVVMLMVVYFHPIERDMAAMTQDKAARAK